MIEIIPGLPSKVAAFNATGKVLLMTIQGLLTLL